jgi:purine-binding chemotaxis protein CheW
VLGILSVRGRITTILDLRLRLGAPAAAVTRSTRILLVEGGASDKGDVEVVGVRVDAVHNVVRLRADEIEPAEVVAGDLPDHVLGLGRPKRAQRDAGDRGVKGTDERDATAEVVILLDPRMLLRTPARARAPGG